LFYSAVKTGNSRKDKPVSAQIIQLSFRFFLLLRLKNILSLVPHFIKKIQESVLAPVYIISKICFSNEKKDKTDGFRHFFDKKGVYS
jgi:hypothetical protein